MLLESLPISGSGAAGLSVCQVAACRMIFWPDLRSKSWDLELRGVQRPKTVCSSSWLKYCRQIQADRGWHHPFVGLSLDFIAVD